MSKRTRAAREAAETQVQEAALDREIEAAALPLRVTPTTIADFDAGAPTRELLALPPRRAAALAASLRRVVAAPDPTNVDTAATFGDLVREGRKRARLDVGDVARRLHVHRDYLSGIETGARSPLALGPEGARRLVSLLAIPPGAAAVALEATMRSALAPTAGFSSRMKRGVPREVRQRILEAALPTIPEKAHVREWRDLISAVSDLDA